MGILQLILLCVTILTVCVAAMAIGIIMRKGGKFPDGEIGSNPNMKKLGIRCAKQEEMMLWRNNGNGQPLANGCCGCSSGSMCQVKKEERC